MAIEAYAAAEQAVEDTLAKCQAVADRVDDGLLRPLEAVGWVNELMLDLLGILDDAFTSSPDPRDDTNGLVRCARQALEDVVGVLEDHPSIPLRTADTVRSTIGSVESRLAHADEVVRLVAVVISWEHATPALAPLRVRRQALDALDDATQMRLQGGFVTRMVRAGLRALGPRWAVNLAAHYLDQHVTDREYWGLVIMALDELSAWSAATELHGIPEEFQRRAVSSLIEVAGHPELTEWAINRVPLHRLSTADRRELSGLLLDRYEVMPTDWISDIQEDATEALEVAYLRALEQAALSWPGAPGRAL
jgi:hypothetical protein